MELSECTPTGANYNYDYNKTGLHATISLFRIENSMNKAKRYLKPTTSDNRINIQTKSEIINTTLFGDKIVDILDFINLTKTDICKICNISSPTLYSWINNQTIPKDNNFETINVIYETIKQIKKNTTIYIFSGYVEPIVTYLSSNDIDKDVLSSLINTAIFQSEERIERINNLRKNEKVITPTKEEQDLLLETNIMLS